MKRRSVVVAAAAVAAVAAGVVVRQQRRQPASERLWTLRFERPGGGELALAEFRGAPLLLNFWAPWCAPCVSEMPLLARFHAEHRSAGWQVVGLAVDQAAPVIEFVRKNGIDFPVALAGAAGLALSRSLGNSAGGLPFSVAFGAGGDEIATKLGSLDAATLLDWSRRPGTARQHL